MRRLRIEFGQYPFDLGQLRHQVVLGMQTAGGVGDQDVEAARFRGLQGVECDRGRIGVLALGDDRDVVALAPDLQLLHGGGAEGVAGGQHQAVAVLLEAARQLADGGGLADAIDADGEQHERLLIGINRQRLGDRFQDCAQLDAQGLQQLSRVGEFARLEAFTDIGHDFGADPHADIGTDQRRLQLIEQVGVEFRVAREQDAEGAGEKTLADRLLDRLAGLQHLGGVDGHIRFCRLRHRLRHCRIRRFFGLWLGFFLQEIEHKAVLRHNRRDMRRIWRRSVRKTGAGHVRIIAGSLRGSKLPVLDADGLRPTGDRVRETLFNWLQNRIEGRRVLDLFAGSGALGFEAVSRGAGEAVLVESHAPAAALLRANRERLKTDRLQVVQGDALAWLAGHAGERFDLVFLDPPFASDPWPRLWPLLLPLLNDGALVYVESAASAPPPLPAGLAVLKEGKTRESRHLLAQWQKPAGG